MIFTERQKFDQWWVWVLLLGLLALPAYGIYKQIFIGENFGDKPMSNTGLIVWLIFMLLFTGFFWLMELQTTIDKDSIRIRFIPFLTRTIKWEDIQSAEILNYGFVGGWGIRLATKYGTVYNMSGNMGLALVLKNGKKICIGTQRTEDLKAVVHKLRG